MSEHTHPDDQHQHEHEHEEDGRGGFLDPFAVARGFMAVALERCPPTSDAALEICAAWTELDEPGTLLERVPSAHPGTALPRPSRDISGGRDLSSAR